MIKISSIKTISHPIINSYVDKFINDFELTQEDSNNKHDVFEKYINNLILDVYGNDVQASYQDMDTDTAFGIDGIAIFIADKLVTTVSDVLDIVRNQKKFDVSFFFIQSKTTNGFNRRDISDFLTGVRRFFNFEECEIPELIDYWEITKEVYKYSSKFKNRAKLNLIFACLSPNKINLEDIHLKSEIDQKLLDLENLTLFEEIKKPLFLSLRGIMNLEEKVSSGLEVTVNMSKQPIPYPKDTESKIKSGYYGLIKLEEFIRILTEEVEGERVLRKGIFDDNIRYYLGSDEKIEVNHNMKEQITGSESYLFGLLNNGITIIGDDVMINSDELTLVNYQVVNGCQTSNVIYEMIANIPRNNNIYLPIRLIATEDEDTKNSIIKATNGQTELKPEQLAALSSIQKAIEVYYETKRENQVELYYERRTEQYRDENIQKARIINIPFQIKSTSALYLDLPHEVSGQYGKVEKQTRGLLFNKDRDLQFLNTYYVSGLAYYRVERFVRNDEDGKKFRRARWHIIMLLKYLTFPSGKIDQKIGKNSDEHSKILEAKLIDENKSEQLIKRALGMLKDCLQQKDENYLEDRKTFERKETTSWLIDHVKDKSKSATMEGSSV